jgi:uncharacterized protein (TIGR02145 family)
MLKYFYILLFVLFIVSPLLGQSTSQQSNRQEKRIALVIGNGDYTEGILANPENDARSMTGDFYFNSTGVVIIEPHDSVKTELAKQTRDHGYSGLLIDSRDNRQYKTVTIGNQVWMAENLNYDSGEGSWTYGNNSVSALVYGRLYNWLTAKLVCPSGWHLPDNKEWSTLSTYLGGDSVAGGKLKETGTKHWESPNTGATNETGFTALPGGIRYDDGEFRFIWTKGEWWSASDTIYDSSYNSDLNAYSVSTFYHKGIIYKDLGLKKFGYSVRCIKD